MGTGGTLSPSSPESFKTRLSQLRTLPLALLPSTRLKNRTVKADLNFFIKQVIGSKLQQGVDGLAQMLASIPY